MAMAHALGLRVVAEGVETAVQLELLRELGCHYAQGFGLGVPMPSHKLERSVHKSGRRRDTGERPMLTLHEGEIPN
jgi:EAL domain-containing protein (putative c-di-GMP-specific phosphodiesterase class I)